MKKLLVMLGGVMILVASGCQVDDGNFESLEVDYFGEAQTISVSAEDWCAEDCVVDPETGVMYIRSEGDGMFYVEGTDRIGEEAQAEVYDAIKAAEAEWGRFAIYTSESLGLTFEYPAFSGEDAVYVVENLDDGGETGDVDVMVGDVVVANLSVEWIDSPTGGTGDMAYHLSSILTNDIDKCDVAYQEEWKGRDVYNFQASVSPYSDDFDESCRINSDIYVFAEQPNKVVIVSGGQGIVFEKSNDTDTFFESIMLFQ